MPKSRQNKNDRKRQRRKDFSNGRDWRSGAPDQRSPYPKSGGSGRVRTRLPAATWRTINDPGDTIVPGGITHIPHPPPSLMQWVLQTIQDRMQQDLIAPQIIYGSPSPSVMFNGVRVVMVDGIAKRPDLKREMQVGEITAYRCWRLEDNYLRSVYMLDVWFPNAIHEGRELQDWDKRGIHAWKEAGSPAFLEYVRDYLDMRKGFPWGCSRPDQPFPTIVTGSVYLWGDVVEHTHGYRAEFARIRSLDWLYPGEGLMGREREMLNELKRLYNV